ncbi:MAG: hypothetical protein ACTSPY_15110 [Candidatus Helarchaeota archaeon]
MQWTIIITIEFILWLIDEFLVLLNFFLLLKDSYSKYKQKISPAYDLGLSLFFLINFIAYTLFILRHFFFEILGLNSYILITREISSVLTLISLIAVTFGIELTLIKKSKFIFTILMSIYVTIITILLLSGFITNILVFPFNLFNLGFLLFLPILYGYIAAKYPGRLRKNSLLMLAGFILIFWGGITNYDNFQDIFPDLLLIPINDAIVRITSVLYIIIGILILTYGFTKFGKEE